MPLFGLYLIVINRTTEFSSSFWITWVDGVFSWLTFDHIKS